MPQSAIDRIDVDFIKPASEIGRLLGELVSESSESSAPLGEEEADVSEGVISVLRLDGIPPPSPFICPECRGALWEVQDGAVVTYRCHVGHAYAQDTLLSQQAINIEQALWSAVRGFEERAELQRRTALRMDIGNDDLRGRLVEGAREQQQMADVLRALVIGPQYEQHSTIGEAVRQEYAG
jgi:two-component system, chemotaxis family, protein-glutamate methylesterase/glutaminase